MTGLGFEPLGGDHSYGTAKGQKCALLARWSEHGKLKIIIMHALAIIKKRFRLTHPAEGRKSTVVIKAGLNLFDERGVERKERQRRPT